MSDYKPVDTGLDEIGQSSGLQAAVLDAAQRGLEYARTAAPAGHYRVEARSLPAGYKNRMRAGAAVINDDPRALSDPNQFHALDASVAAIEGGL